MSANTTRTNLFSAIVLTRPIDSHNDSNIPKQAHCEDIHRLRRVIRRITEGNGAHGVSVGQDAAKMISGPTELGERRLHSILHDASVIQGYCAVKMYASEACHLTFHARQATSAPPGSRPPQQFHERGPRSTGSCAPAPTATTSRCQPSYFTGSRAASHPKHPRAPRAPVLARPMQRLKVPAPSGNMHTSTSPIGTRALWLQAYCVVDAQSSYNSSRTAPPARVTSEDAT